MARPLAAVLVVLLAACTNSNLEEAPSASIGTAGAQAAVEIPPEVSPPLTVALLAGKDTRAGTVTASIDGADLVVEYRTADGWTLRSTQLHVAGDWTQIPQNPNHHPTPGQFDFKSDQADGTTTATYRRALTTLPGGALVIAAHAELLHSSGRSEGGWAEGTRFVPKGTWAMWFRYEPSAMSVVEQGPGWVKLHLRGQTSPEQAAPSRTTVAPAVQSFDENVFVLNGQLGIENAPLPDLIREDLLESQTDAADIHSVSEDTANGIVESIELGELTPEIAAIAEPDDAEGARFGPFGLFGRCATKMKSARRSVDLDRLRVQEDHDFGGGTVGAIGLSGELEGAATGVLNYEVRRYKVFGKCVPYAMTPKNVQFFGDVRAYSALTVAAGIATEEEFGPWEVANPYVGEHWFMIGYIPVRLVYHVPIHLGIKLRASAQASVTFNAGQQAQGTFNYVCTRHGCSGTSDIVSTDLGDGESVTAGIQGRLEVEPYATLGFGVGLYHQSVLEVVLAMKPTLYGDLWGYYGNNCGDADDDGHFETVHALTFDLDRQVPMILYSEAFGELMDDRIVADGRRTHTAFWDLGGSPALAPLFHGPASLAVNTQGDYLVKIRPCWPYEDKLKYRVEWGDGSPAVETEEWPVGTFVRFPKTWTEVGPKTIVATSWRDKHGRDLDESTVRTIQVTPPPDPCASCPAEYTCIDQRCEPPRYAGFLDGATCDSLWGWAWDANRPNTPIRIDLFADGQPLIENHLADRYRSDLEAEGIGNGYHAFNHATPAALKDGQSHLITATIAGTGSPLSGSGRSIVCEVAPPGCGPDGASCGPNGDYMCVDDECVCANCGSPECCGASGNPYCDGETYSDPNTSYVGTCQSSLGACGAATSFDGVNNVFHAGAIRACVQLNGSYTWLERSPSPGCQRTNAVCDVVCSANYPAQLQCAQSGWWTPVPPAVAECPEIPPEYLCH